MATAVQPLPFPDAHTFHQQRQPRQAQQHQAYTAAIPFFPDTNAIIGNAQPNLFKQINIIPGLDAENAVVDTGLFVFNFVLIFFPYFPYLSENQLQKQPPL